MDFLVIGAFLVLVTVAVGLLVLNRRRKQEQVTVSVEIVSGIKEVTVLLETMKIL